MRKSVATLIDFNVHLCFVRSCSHRIHCFLYETRINCRGENVQYTIRTLLQYSGCADFRGHLDDIWRKTSQSSCYSSPADVKSVMHEYDVCLNDQSSLIRSFLL